MGPYRPGWNVCAQQMARKALDLQQIVVRRREFRRLGRKRTVDEWFDPTDAYLGPQKNLLTLLALVGIEGVSKPVLAKVAARP